MPPGEPARWPFDWYYDHKRIRCIVPNCGFRCNSENVSLQWTQAHDHCLNTSDPEHNLLEIMLRQRLCVVCDEPASFGAHTPGLTVRRLFHHEEKVHNSTTMSHLCSFVRLAREGRIRFSRPGANINTVGATEPDPNCERFAFLRMMEKVQALPPAALELLYQKSGFHLPYQQTQANLGKILTSDPLTQPGDDPPFWWPVQVDHFLWHCRPHPDDPADAYWRHIWSDLRARYADGRI